MDNNYIGNIARCIICTLGMAANLLILYIVARYPSMRTACNVYVANLAATDFLFCLVTLTQSIVIISDPPYLVGETELVFPLVYLRSCDVSRVILVFLASTSIFLLTVIAVERYRAITNPLSCRQHGTVKHAVKTCAAVWLVAALAAAIDTIARNIVTDDWTFTSASLHASCVLLKTESSDASDPFFIMVLLCFLFLYVLPICVMIPLHVHILVKLRQSRRLAVRETRSGDQAFLMVFVVTVLFLVNWLPFHIISFLIHLLHSKEEHVAIIVALAFAVINSVANPFLYALLGKKVHARVKKMFCCKQDTRPTIQAIQAGQSRATATGQTTGGTEQTQAIDGIGKNQVTDEAEQAQATGIATHAQAAGETEHAQATDKNGQAQATCGTEQAQATGETEQAQATDKNGQAQATCGTEQAQAQATGETEQAQATGGTGRAHDTCGTKPK
ncbi:somatostatin receptor type 2-like [Branchiostoma lanceolatum]|uniref:somatostatin receptor type 2-like n=1 Tax=Branchiostoma lanceolatum TaxID=7740 RepID=UPI0034562C7C